MDFQTKLLVVNIFSDIVLFVGLILVYWVFKKNLDATERLSQEAAKIKEEIDAQNGRYSLGDVDCFVNGKKVDLLPGCIVYDAQIKPKSQRPPPSKPQG